MKVPCFMLCYVILISYNVSAIGDINKFFKNLDIVAQKVRSDVKNTFARNIQSEDRIVFKESEEDKRDFGTTVTIQKKYVNVETTTQPATTTVISAAKSNATTGKDGRENFAGACSTGFQRTADGRCMPTF